MNNISRQMSGFLYVALSAFMYATLPILGKYAYCNGLKPEQILFLRYAFAFLLLAPYLVFVKKTSPYSSSPLVWLQGLVLVIGSLLYFFALKLLTVSLVTVILFSYPVLVSLLSLVIYKEKLGPGHFLAVVLAVAGAGLVGGIGAGPLKMSSTGIIFAAATVICYATFSLIGQKTASDSAPLRLTASISLAGIIIISLVFRDLEFLTRMNSTQFLIGLAMGLVNTILAVSLYLKGIQQIGAASASLVSVLEPVLTVILACILLNEQLSPLQLLGSSLVLISMFIAVRTSSKLSLNDTKQ